jgi:hypothetical protein
MISRFLLFLSFVVGVSSSVFSIQDLISQNIVGYVSHDERSKTVVVKMRDVMGVQEGFSLSQVVTATKIPGVSLPGTQACFFDGDDWVHVEQLICDGELHWCKWIDKGTAEIVDDLIVPFGSAFSYALPEGVTRLVFSGEFSEEDFFAPKLEFVDDETYDNIRRELLEMSSNPVQKRVVLIENDVKIEELQVSETQSVTVTNYVTRCVTVTNYVDELKKRFLVRHNSGKVEPAIYSLKLNRACNPNTGYPLNIDINKVVFIEDESVPADQRASGEYCLRFYNLVKGDFTVPQVVNVEISERADNNIVSESWFSWILNKLFDTIWGRVTLLLGGGIALRRKIKSVAKLFYEKIKNLFRIKSKE